MKSSAGLQWRAGQALQDLVSFRELNLVARPWPMQGRVDALFCRNVMIYFDAPAQRELAASLVARLLPGGQLYIGHSERVGADHRDLVSDGLTTYRRPETTL